MFYTIHKYDYIEPSFYPEVRCQLRCKTQIMLFGLSKLLTKQHIKLGIIYLYIGLIEH